MQSKVTETVFCLSWTILKNAKSDLAQLTAEYDIMYDSDLDKDWID